MYRNIPDRAGSTVVHLVDWSHACQARVTVLTEVYLNK